MGDGLNDLWHLHQELSVMKRPLEALLSRYKTGESFIDLHTQIRKDLDVIAETVATCMNIHMAAEGKSRFGQLFTTAARRESDINLALEVKRIRKDKIPLLRKHIATMSIMPQDARDMTVTAEAIPESKSKKTHNIVGFEAEAQDLIDFINAESNKLEIASIVGMAGLGKTTLTRKIFEDPRVENEFPVRIWVDVSDTLNMKNILLTILKNFNANPPDEPVEELIVKVRDHLKNRKFLIVMDDIWTIKAWDKVKEILPKCNHMGRVLLTTCHQDVAVLTSTRGAHYLRFLTANESWELLQYEVYRKVNAVPEDLKGIGQVIARDCNRLPLSLVLIGGILGEKIREAESNVSAMKKGWEEVLVSVKSYLGGNTKKIYERIPNEMRNCFLYLGVYPEDADIPVNELIRLWIAEGFIPEVEEKSLEQVALAILKELINRNLVMVKEKKLDGEPKVCNMHESVREICKTVAKYENLNIFQEITCSAEGFEPRCNVENFHRLCVHSHVLDMLKKTKNVDLQARSFLCFHHTPVTLDQADMAVVTDSFRFLKVYDAKNIKFSKFPQKFMQLQYLRYLTLVVEHLTSLPEVISELWYLQTLIMDVSSRTLDTKADIWKMRQLRHIKTKASITLRKDLKGDGGDNLQTLSRLSPESCTNEVFQRAKNLITLGIQGELNKLGNSDCLSNLVHLHKLKLVNEVPDGLAVDRPLRRLSDSHCYPPNLRILVLSGTYIQWSKMSILSSLGFLEVLKLKNNAFRGNLWDVENVFHSLKHLQIERSTELVCWKATSHHFPKLRLLLLNNCEKLIEVPTGVCENLEKLYVERVSKDLVSSAKAIDDEKRKNKVAFELYIASGDKSPWT